MAMRRTIKLMSDYDCFSVWEEFEDGVENIDPEQLPLSQKLKRSLIGWAESYDRTLNREDPISSGFSDADSETAFELEGLRLWKELQSELGPNYHVIYFSQIKGRLVD